MNYISLVLHLNVNYQIIVYMKNIWRLLEWWACYIKIPDYYEAKRRVVSQAMHVCCCCTVMNVISAYKVHIKIFV